MTEIHLKLPLDKTVSVVTMYFVMSDAVRFFKALADTTRWRIVRLVLDRSLCVCELADILEMPQSSVSSHVQIIRKAGMLDSESCGKWTYFRVGKEFVALVKSLGKRFPAAAEFASDVERAEKRLAKREESCCPGPEKLDRGWKTKMKTKKES